MNQVTVSAPQSSQTMRLILVEDSDADAFLIAEAARELSYDLQIRRFSTVIGAIEGVAGALTDAPHGLLLDINLPGGSGLDVLRYIRDSEGCCHLRVVIMTSSISSRDREAAEGLGIEGYLLKPNDFYQFVGALGEALKLLSRS
jgi:CheY-like chemotaxis protein